MACAAKSMLKPLSMVNNCLTSVVPSMFTSKTIHSYLAVPTRPLKLHLCWSSSSSLPYLLTFKKKTQFTRMVSFVASRQEEDDPMVLEKGEYGWGEQGWNEAHVDSEGDVEVEEEGQVGWIEGAEDAESDKEVGFPEPESVAYSNPPEEAKLFVGNLPYDVDSEKLAHLFEQAGVVEIAEVIYNRVTDQSRGFGFVTMSTVEEAEKAEEMFNRYDLNGRLLTVNKAAPRGSQQERPIRVFEPGCRIYVGNLPWTVDNARLEQVFSEHGKVTSARVVQDRETGRSRGFGFVMMSSEAEMNDAIANLDGQSLDGRIIKVNVAEERPRRSNF